MRSAFLAGSEGGVQDHRDVVGGHAVGHRVQRLVEVAPRLLLRIAGGGLTGVADCFGDLARRQVFVTGAVGDGVHDGDRSADQVADVGYDCSAGRRGSTTTRRSGSWPMLTVVTSGSLSSARWMARRSNACIASSVMGSPVTLTWRAARNAISRTVCSRRCR